MVARAEMAGDDELVLESVLPIDPVVEVHVAMLVDFFLTVLRCNERKLGNENLRLEHLRASIKTLRRTVTQVGDERRAYLSGDFGARLAEVADLLAHEVRVLRLELPAAVPNDVAHGGDRVRGGGDGDDQLPGEFDLFARRDADQLTRQPPPVEPCEGFE